ncbi:hypothetical protein HII28_17275 [Planctomonas sp. JC2975]|uniref:hypothetical protein n=1 Tax=Planctomonas sp. JC2975 TaxID=2729626 RepID=UPI001472CC9E|nr:hypothetical protein [Planctomonas sp. JC2975]NNC13620.1 hypothetical protein [Planctomonas sp. JC2975]
MTSTNDRRTDLYGYLLTTGSREQILEAHVAAFRRLSADDRRALFLRLQDVSRTPAEHPQAGDADELARIATDIEFESPGRLSIILESPTASGDYSTLLDAVAHNIPRRIETLTAFREWSASVDDDWFD